MLASIISSDDSPRRADRQTRMDALIACPSFLGSYSSPRASNTVFMDLWGIVLYQITRAAITANAPNDVQVYNDPPLGTFPMKMLRRKT